MELRILTEKAQQGDETAFAEICERFRGLVKKLANQPHLRPLGEEAEAEAWLAVVYAVRTYRADAGVQVAGYIESQVKYKLWNVFKKEKRKWEHEMPADASAGETGPSLLEMLAAGDDVAAAVEQKEAARRLRAALAALPERQCRAVILTLIQGRRLAEAALQLGVTSQAVHNLQRRGLARLRNLFFSCHTSVKLFPYDGNITGRRW